MWMLVAFDRDSDALVSEFPLHEVNEELVRRIWSLTADDPAFDSYPVTHDIVALIRDYVNVPLALDELDYFVEYESQE